MVSKQKTENICLRYPNNYNDNKYNYNPNYYNFLVFDNSYFSLILYFKKVNGIVFDIQTYNSLFQIKKERNRKVFKSYLINYYIYRLQFNPKVSLII